MTGRNSYHPSKPNAGLTGRSYGHATGGHIWRGLKGLDHTWWLAGRTGAHYVDLPHAEPAMTHMDFCFSTTVPAAAGSRPPERYWDFHCGSETAVQAAKWLCALQIHILIAAISTKSKFIRESNKWWDCTNIHKVWHKLQSGEKTQRECSSSKNQWWARQKTPLKAGEQDWWRKAFVFLLTCSAWMGWG